MCLKDNEDKKVFSSRIYRFFMVQKSRETHVEKTKSVIKKHFIDKP
jgi:hypothetical protein